VKIGITGVNGFIGQHLAQTLMGRGHEVVGIDKHGVANGFDYGDLTQPNDARKWLEHHQPDICVHLAAQVGRLFGDADYRHTIESNATMTALVAKACGDLNIQLAYTSTSEVYGDNGAAVCDEIDGPFSLPHNLYGLSKLWGEQVAALYAPLDLITFRPSMPYGPGVPPGQGRAALPNIVWQAVTGQRIPIHKGSERSWCWIGDAVDAMVAVIESGQVGPFNVGRDDTPLAMVALAKMVCDLVGASRDLIVEIDPPQAQTVVKRLATQRIRDLGWEPKVDLPDGIERVRQWVERFDERGREKRGFDTAMRVDGGHSLGARR
jgi:nucleoside-diphosphate-sugar epimerase